MGIGPEDANVLFGHQMPPIDPLTVGWWYDLQPPNWGCTCPAKEDDALLHWWVCKITPIFASMDTSELSNIFNEIACANLSLTQTVIKCAVCGRELLARDADVIYRAPISVIPGITLDSRLPEDIVKAVCPEHNRKGRIGYQRQAWAGY